MKITSIQKVIKVGSSLAVTIPAKDAQFYAITAGEDLEVNYTRPESATTAIHSEAVVAMTQKLITRHQEALKSLSQR